MSTARSDETKHKQLIVDLQHQMQELAKQLEAAEERNENLNRIQTEFESIFKEVSTLKSENNLLMSRNEALTSDANVAIEDRETINKELIKLKAMVRDREHKHMIEVEGLHQNNTDLEAKINNLVLS